MFDPLVIHLWPKRNPWIYPVTNVPPIFNSFETYVRLISDKSVAPPVTHVWPIHNPSDEPYLTYLLL